MNEMIDILKEWPTLIQGAIGSAIFWLFLLVAQKLVSSGSKILSTKSREQRESWLISRAAKLRAFSGTQDKAGAQFALSSLKYRALRPVYKGFTWLSLGLAAYPLFELGLTVGALGAVYFFLKAYEVVSPIQSDDNGQEFDNVLDELRELGKLPQKDVEIKN
ncbi:hypothetical protein AB2S62_20070 [Vibrio sp. NTOU-M3]|uniref:hypothetical protein n=1 Tax=Vibrio sp. NTOU-M3 TaxID=3234954 RepID=UPI00349FA672